MFNPQSAIRRLGIPVRELCGDSRCIRRHSVFVAYPGHVHDGRQHIAAALAAGAAGVFWDPKEFSWPPTCVAPNVPIPSLAKRLGLLADVVYGTPSRQLFVAAVTGTNGKTTVSHFAAQLLAQHNLRTGIVGTLGAGLWGKKMSPTLNTTPEAIVLHRFLRDFAAAGADAACIEASSHGIKQRRLNGLRLAAAALMNIGRDHLDYHGDIRAYRRSKAKLLQTEGLKTAIVNADSPPCVAAAKHCRAKNIWTFGGGGKELRLLSVQQQQGAQLMELDGAAGRQTVRLNMLGQHNIQNFLAANLIVRAAGVPPQNICAEQLISPRGRLQRINPNQRPAIYVDYAHTPEALTAALSALRHRRGKLWTIFGCGGDRDSGKRRKMGAIAATLADVAIVSDDNPRTESAAAIRAQILSANSRLREIADRATAICTAIAEAHPEDTILIAGKGHEEYQDINGRRRSFSDAQTALRAIQKC